MTAMKEEMILEMMLTVTRDEDDDDDDDGDTIDIVDNDARFSSSL